MPQSRTGSFIEACANVILGFSIAVLSNVIILPLFGLTPSLRDSTGIALVFTGISLVRSFIIRRLFNAIRWRNTK